MAPGSESRRLGYVLKNDRALVDKPAGSDGPFLFVIDGLKDPGGGDSAHAALSRLHRLLSLTERMHRTKSDKQPTAKDISQMQVCISIRLLPRFFPDH